MGQSSNDVIPSAMHISAAEQLKNFLIPALEELHGELEKKAKEFWDVIKIGRTHLMDATPVRLGQEFSGYAQQVAYAKERAQRAIAVLQELALGGTAVGTGLNRHVDFPKKVMTHLAHRTGIPFREATNHFEAQGGKGRVRRSERLAEDDRGQPVQNRERHSLARERTALRHRRDSIAGNATGQLDHAGKSEPGHVRSDDDGLRAGDRQRQQPSRGAGANGNFELNVMMPVMAHHLLESIRILKNACDVFAEKCVAGITANEKRCAELVELSMAMVTSLAPKIGYDRAAEIAKESARTGKTVREICREKKILPEGELNDALDPVKMTEPGGTGSGGG